MLVFNTVINEFHIFESIRCLKILEGDGFVFLPEFRMHIPSLTGQ